MTTTTYTGAVTGPLPVNVGDEADLTNATVTGAGVRGHGSVIVKLVNSSITTSDPGRGVNDDAPGTLTVSVDATSSIAVSAADAVGSNDAAVNLTNAGTIRSDHAGSNAVYLGVGGSTVTNSGTINGAGAASAYAIFANDTATITNSGTLNGGQSGALYFNTSGGVLNLSDGTTAGVINGSINNNGPLIISTNGLAVYTLSSVVSGLGSLTDTGPGVLTLSNANTYGGGTTVTRGGTVVANHSSFSHTYDTFGSGAVTLDNGGLTLAGGSSLANDVVVGSGGANLTANGAFVGGAISGAGSLTTSGNITFNGDESGYSGALTVASGTLTLSSANAMSLSSASVSVASGASLSVRGPQAVASLGGAGTVVGSMAGTNTLTVGGSGASTMLAGVLQDADASARLALTKTGAGTFTLSGTNTYTGATAVNAGVLAVDGSLTSAVTVANGATFRGTGTDSAGITVQAGGTLAPGEGTGTFTAASLNASGAFFDTLVAGGATGKLVTTGGAGITLQAGASLSLGYTGGAEAYGTVFLIAQATGGGVVAGTFSNAPTNGTVLSSGGHSFQVAYTATTVTLTDVTNTAPTLGGSGLTTFLNDNQTAKPLANVTVTDPDAGQTETATVTLSNAANGVLSGLTATAQPGVYTATGTVAQVNAALQGAVFTPTANQVAPGGNVTTTFTVADTDSAGGAAPAPATATATVTSINDAPTLAGTQAGQAVGDRNTINPFATVTVNDPDTGQGETATITLSNPANGAITGGGFTPTATPGVYTVTEAAGGAGASAAAIQTDLRAATFTPTPGVIGQPATTTTFTVSVSDGTVTATDAATAVSATHTTNTAPVLGGFAAGQTTTDQVAATPFATATITDPDAQQQTVTVTLSAAANGALSGGGFAAVAGSPGVYRVVAPDAATAQADLRALSFTPTQNQVAPGATVTTGFTVQVNDTQTTVQNTQTTERVTSVNDAPAFGAFQTLAAQTPATPVLLQPQGLTINDPDVNAGIRSAFVIVAAGQTAGDVLAIQGTLPAGITATYNSANFILTFSSANPLPDSTYAQALSQVTFVHNGVTDAGSRLIGFGVTDDQGASARAVTEVVTVGAYSFTGAGGPGNAGTPSQQAGYTVQIDNLLRAGPNDAAMTDPSSPIYAQVQAEKAIALQLDQGQISAQDAQSALFHLVDGTTSVAEISYAFFTGKTPTAAGLNYLVHSAANATDLNDPYYAQFTTENRYINFAANLATGQGAGAAQFQANYGALSLSDTVTKAYAAIFGTTPTADKVSAILNAQVSNGLGGTETRAQYFSDITGGSAAAQKAAAIGFLLADSVKEGFGAYQQADQHFLQDLAHGTAAFNIDLLAAYGQAPALVGQPVVDPTLGS